MQDEAHLASNLHPQANPVTEATGTTQGLTFVASLRATDIYNQQLESVRKGNIVATSQWMQLM